MHDYNIEDTYILDDEIADEHISLLNKIIKDIKKDALPILKAFDDFEVCPIILADKLLGIYCFGTCENPVIGIDIGNILIGCDEYNVDIAVAIKTTVLHELKHAWQEWHDKPFDEKEAEDFAYNNS